MQQLRFFLSEAWEYLARGQGATVTSLLALTAVLFLLSLVLLVTHNVQGLARNLQARKGLTVFLQDGTTEDRARELWELFGSFGEVSEARFVDRETALADIEKDLGGFPVASTLGENPLPHSIVLTLTPAAAAQEGTLRRLAEEIRVYEDVDDVNFGGEWVETLDRNLKKLYTANTAVGFLAAIAVFVVLLTTLRLVFISRRETIRILVVVGASDEYIRAPFLLLGGMQSGISAVLALLLLGLAHGLSESFLPGMRFLPTGWQFLFLFGAVGLGTLASWVSFEPAMRGLERRSGEVLR